MKHFKCNLSARKLTQPSEQYSSVKIALVHGSKSVHQIQGDPQKSDNKACWVLAQMFFIEGFAFITAGLTGKKY